MSYLAGHINSPPSTTACLNKSVKNSLAALLLHENGPLKTEKNTRLSEQRSSH